MGEKESATIEVFRFDPNADKEPRYDKFEVPYKGRTVLDVLRYIHENLDSTLVFRWACTKGFCRTCVVFVNGNPALACTKMAEKNMRIEPHKKFEILKDLIIDLDKPNW